MIIDHNRPEYQEIWKNSSNKYNGAFFYSKEIVENIIPKVNTDRNWITVNIQGIGCDHAIVFIHNNLNPEERYDWLKQYHDLVLVCGIEQTMPKVAHLGTPIYLPLSVDVAAISQYKTEKTREAAFVGRQIKKYYDGVKLPPNLDYLENMPRQMLLKEMAKYKRIYAVGRCAIEAKVLGCEVRPYDPRFPDTNRWKVIDNSEAAEILQKKLNNIARKD